jgi:response regulator RpfG family c-di-GMP phosphodiesterase
MNPGESISVLYLDDEMHNLTAFRASFRRNFNVFTAINAIDAKEVLEKEDIHVIVTDQRMPVTTGVDFLESIIPLFPKPIRILLTGYADINAVIDSINRGHVYSYIQKPWSEEELKTSIQKAYEYYKLLNQQ